MYRGAWLLAATAATLLPTEAAVISSPNLRTSHLLSLDSVHLEREHEVAKGQSSVPPSLAVTKRLRGGDASSMIDSLKRSYLAVPPLTRTWFSVILAFSGLTQVGLLQQEALGLDAAATLHKLQLWRPITAASFFGGLQPQLLQKLYYLISFGKELEITLGIGEFARALASCVATLSLIFHLLGWPFTGDAVVMAMTVLCCQQNPDQPFGFYGIKFSYQFLPLAQLVLSYMFTTQIPWADIVGLFVVRRIHQLDSHSDDTL